MLAENLQDLAQAELEHQKEQGLDVVHPINDSLIIPPPPAGEDVDTCDNDFDLRDLYDPRSTWTPEQKLQAALAYTITGTSKGVHRHTGIPPGTVRRWKYTASWWPDAVNTMRKRKQDELDAKLTGTIDQIVDSIIDRVENGDTVLDKNGKPVKKPMGGRDLAIVMGVIYDKRALLRGDATSRVERVTTDDTLKVLTDRFTKLSQEMEAKTIDGEVVIEE